MIGALPIRTEGRPRRRRPQHARRGHTALVLSTGVLCALVVVLLVLSVGPLLGYHALNIRSGSMAPTIAVGDVVIDTPVSPLGVHPGEIVTFRDPALGQQTVTHRVVSVHRSGNRVFFVTKGDANVAAEHWNVSVGGHIGREIAIVPTVGRVLGDLGTPLARVVEVTFFALCLAYLGLTWIWRRPGTSAVGFSGA